MSAWLCSQTHISAIVNTADRTTLRRFSEEITRKDPVAVPKIDAKTRASNGGISLMSLMSTDDQPEDIMFHALLRENFRSLHARYDDREGARLEVDPAALYHEHIAKYNAVVTLKLIACFEYQSCEHDEWNTSIVKAFCEAVRHDAINQLPGYDDAPWGID